LPVFVLRRAPRSPALEPRRVRAVCELMLSELGLAEAELSVLLTNDDAIHELNLAHRGKDKPTDVLSFPQEFDEPKQPQKTARKAASKKTTSSTPRTAPTKPQKNAPPRLLGDVVISLDTAERQARSRKRELYEEVRFLLAHGILHLIGYDHAEPEEKREMDRMTRRLVRAAS
jgi:probable rRNA maturation factor